MNYLLYRPASEVEEEVPFRGRYLPSRLRTAGVAGRAAADVASVAFLQDTLQVLFGLLASTMLPAKPNLAHQAIASFAEANPGRASIITTNYDCCIDLAFGGANLAFDYCIPFCNGGENGDPQGGVPLIKLHGSLNWYYCETCQQVQLVDIDDMVCKYTQDHAPYTVIGICKSCGGQRRALLVPPLAMKFDVAPPLTPLIELAKKEFEKADLIVVLGFSFAEADVYISRMISKSMQTRKQDMMIVDPDPSVAQRVQRKFKASIPNFDEKRITGLQGNCAELLPRFLTGEIKDEAAQQKKHEPSRNAARAKAGKRKRKAD